MRDTITRDARIKSRLGHSILISLIFMILTSASLHAEGQPRGMIKCANLIYGKNKSSVCFSPEFLKQIQKDTNITADTKFVPVKIESAEMYRHPFAVMTGEGEFQLTQAQRTGLRDYLTHGGFVVASAGCSSKPWASSFQKELRQIFPDTKLARLDLSHPIFHTVYDINKLDKKKSSGTSKLEGLEIDGKVVLVFSADGLNDTANAGGNCCCCGGNEMKNSQKININLLAYTLTH